MTRRSSAWRWTIALLAFGFTFETANGFIISDPSFVPWARTASGRRTSNGTPATLTWSIVPDGTTVSDGFDDLGSSNLLEFLNDNFEGDENQTDHTLQPWFPIIEASMNRWDELSGLTFEYEPNDDGGNHSNRRGIRGTRGDIRLSGVSVDGPSGILAFNFFPESGGDMTIDTDDLSFATNDNRDFRFFRNTIMHEVGHGLNLGHVISDSSRLLMEPTTNTAFDGPQLDEIRAAHFYFGDEFEATNNGQGNGSLELATSLGELAVGQSIELGGDADRRSQIVRDIDTDYVSISNEDDLDYFSFTVPTFASLGAELKPLGGEFDQAEQGRLPEDFNANARSNLTLTILDSNGATIQFVDETDVGESEFFDELTLAPGEYFARIEGEADTIQLYSLTLDFETLPGDYNLNGFVDAADFTVWRDAVNNDFDARADGDGNGLIDLADYEVWIRNFGTTYTVGASNVAAVPEPTTSNGFFAIAGVCLLVRRGARKVCRDTKV